MEVPKDIVRLRRWTCWENIIRGANGMTIEKIIVENFTVFEKIEIDFCNGINVFIGENGAGKTHLLKLLYAFCKHKNEFKSAAPLERTSSFYLNLISCFQNNKLEELIRYNVDISANNVPVMVVCKVNGMDYVFRFLNTESEFDYKGDSEYIPCVYIPAKEMLTHARLEKDFIERNLPFDITLIDILNKAGVSTVKELTSEMQGILDRIVQIIGGKVVYSNDRFYIDKGKNVLIDFAVEAEGFKKLGLIYRLIETGYLKKGGVLIWDEPESNLSPKLIPVLVDIILALEQAGVQMFFATHDYNFMKYFSIKRKEANEIAFFSLFQTENGVACERGDDYDLLEHNPIIDGNTKLLEDEIEGTL